MGDGYRLGIDFGTSSTVAMIGLRDGSVRPLLLDASPLLSSGVLAGPGGELFTGVDAERAALGNPAGLEPNPKRRIDDTTVWLGERDWPVADLIAAVLRRVMAEAVRVTAAQDPQDRDNSVATEPRGTVSQRRPRGGRLWPGPPVEHRRNPASAPHRFHAR